MWQGKWVNTKYEIDFVCLFLAFAHTLALHWHTHCVWKMILAQYNVTSLTFDKGYRILSNDKQPTSPQPRKGPAARDTKIVIITTLLPVQDQPVQLKIQKPFFRHSPNWWITCQASSQKPEGSKPDRKVWFIYRSIYVRVGKCEQFYTHTPHMWPKVQRLSNRCWWVIVYYASRWWWYYHVRESDYCVYWVKVLFLYK